MRAKVPAVLAIALLLVAINAAYANHFYNSFHFDHSDTIENKFINFNDFSHGSGILLSVSVAGWRACRASAPCDVAA